MKCGYRVMYRYLNKGNSLFGTVVEVCGSHVRVKMDDGEVLFKCVISWDIV